MRSFFISIVTLVIASAVQASASVNIEGTYIYQGDAVVQNDSGLTPENHSILYFPTTQREGKTNYSSYIQPPESWYAKVPMNTSFTIRQSGTQLSITHLPLFGAYVPSQIGKDQIESKVELSPMSKFEKFEWTSDGFKIQIKESNFPLGGRKDSITVKKLPSGDLELIEAYTGWALIPFPSPIHLNTTYLMHLQP